ncbi:hypothetical protein NKG94_26360 [Micromonospora sp. M12]
MYDAAPVATDADIPAGSSMEAIRKRGYLNIGGSLDAPLLASRTRSAAPSRASTPTWRSCWRSTSSASPR